VVRAFCFFKEAKMKLKASDGRWSVALCGSGNTVHLTYGNATLHVLMEDIGDLTGALARVDEALRSAEPVLASKDKSLH
jgi:hypothetical protein